jgi:hypothetical protein
MAGCATEDEKEERTGDRRESQHCATLSVAHTGNNYKASSDAATERRDYSNRYRHLSLVAFLSIPPS